jgi:4-phospho-D-threonate 3-dehydrogenase / 4-phospho-D-erythronate 3-dehydrogenase
MKRIAVTMGDPAGVGPELCLRLLASPEIGSLCMPVIFGDAEVLQAVAKETGLAFATPVISLEEWQRSAGEIASARVLDLRRITLRDFIPGAINAATGDAAFAYVNHAIDAVLAGQVAAVTTAPLNKEAMHLAGHHFPGHTEIFATRTDASRSCMMQYSDEITCTFVTVHVGLRDVPAALTTQRILDVIELSAEALQRIRKRRPKIGVLGLNPHAGEHGLFGDREEERIIIPAIEQARAKGIDVEGPIPGDTAFLPWKRRSTDVFVCMYHDQGHIPVKALAFDKAVNTTLGLPVIRTSVDHGTALDIAWQGKADPGSLFAAIRLAVTLSANQ